MTQDFLDRHKPVVRVLLWICVVLMVGGVASIFFLPPDRVEAGPPRIITIFPSWISSNLGMATLIFICTLFGLSLLAIRCGQNNSGYAGIYLCGIGLPALGVGLFLLSFRGPWVIYDQLTAPDGKTYLFATSEILQGQDLVIGRMLKSSLFSQSFEVLASTNGDWPCSWAPMIRPKDRVHEHYGQLYLSTTGVLIGIRIGNLCFMTYDPATLQEKTGEAVEGVSPFLLLGPADQPYEKDVEAVLTWIAKPVIDDNNHPLGRPSRAALIKELNNPNPEVQKLAGKFLELSKQ